MELNFKIFPELKIERLVLRNLENSDSELIQKLHSDPVVNSFVGRANESTLEKAQKYIIKIQNLIAKNQCIYWVISLKENPDLVGSICLWNFDIENEAVEIGYEMLSEFQGKGIITQAIKKSYKLQF